MAKTLELMFETGLGKAVTLTVEAPREDLTPVEIKTGMDSIITQAVFEVEGSPFTTVKGARIVERNVQEYDLV